MECEVVALKKHKMEEFTDDDHSLMTSSVGIYMDYQATTPLEDEVFKSIASALRDGWGNPSSTYKAGTNAKALISEARISISKMINAQKAEIIFTSGGTESNNMVLHTALKHFNKIQPYQEMHEKLKIKPHIITSNIEHDSVVKVLEHFDKEGLADVTYVPVSHKTGRVEVEDVLKAVQPATCLVTVMMVNNETGIIQPIADITKAIKSLKRNCEHEVPRILLHTDAGQAIGKITVDVCELGVDYLTVVGHKFYGPRIGALYVNKKYESTPLYPLLFGGGQENNLRPGTENTGMIAGLGKAAELVCRNLTSYATHMKMVRDYLEKKLEENYGDDIVFNGRFDGSQRIPNICNVSFTASGMLGHEILSRCKHLQASVGAACHSGQHHKPSPILLAIGVPNKTAKCAVRMSVGRETSKNDIDIVVKDLMQATGRLIT